MNSILLQAHAEDQDLGYNGDLVYVISDGDRDAAFQINMTTGLVSVLSGRVLDGIFRKFLFN